MQNDLLYLNIMMGKSVWLLVSITIIVIGTVIGILYLRQQQKVNQAAVAPIQRTIETPIETSKPKEEPVPAAPTFSTPVVKKTAAEVRQQIISAITSKNYAALEEYMAENVHVRIESSDCCGTIKKAETIKQLDYLNEASGMWDFSDSNVHVVALRAASPEFYGSSAIVGVSTDEFVVSFQLNSENKINEVSMASTYKLLVP